MKTITDYNDVSPFGDKLGNYQTHGLGGDHWHFKFDNGYGASVVRFTFDLGFGAGGSYGSSAGLWELGVLGPDGHLTYDTPITDDVLGHLTESLVADTLDAIAALPAEVTL